MVQPPPAQIPHCRHQRSHITFNGTADQHSCHADATRAADATLDLSAVSSTSNYLLKLLLILSFISFSSVFPGSPYMVFVSSLVCRNCRFRFLFSLGFMCIFALSFFLVCPCSLGSLDSCPLGCRVDNVITTTTVTAAQWRMEKPVQAQGLQPRTCFEMGALTIVDRGGRAQRMSRKL